MIACPHWKDNGSAESGDCAHGYFGGRPARRVCVHICQLGRFGEPAGVPSVTAPAPQGPGTRLHRMLSTLGIAPAPGCRCLTMAGRMDREGPDWCRTHIGEIVAVMRAEAARRGMPFIEAAARLLIYAAIRAAERDPLHRPGSAIAKPVPKQL